MKAFDLRCSMRHTAPPNPEIQWRAAKLLCNLSWSRPGDLDAVRRVLRQLPHPDHGKRMEAIASLGAMKSVAVPALIRLLEEEPSDEVRWVIVGQLRPLMEEGSQPVLANLKPPADDAPTRAAAGWGLQKSNPDLAVSHFRRAIAVAATQPVDDHGEIDLLIQVLSAGRSVDPTTPMPSTCTASRWDSPKGRLRRSCRGCSFFTPSTVRSLDLSATSSCFSRILLSPK